MTSYSPSFTPNQRRTDLSDAKPRYSNSKRLEYSQQKQAYTPSPQNRDYIKVFEHGAAAEKNFFSNEIVNDSSNYSGELTFQPNQLEKMRQRPGFGSFSQEDIIDQYESTQHPEETGEFQESAGEDDDNNYQEENEQEGDGKVISEYLMEAFKQDNAVLKYLKHMVKSTPEPETKPAPKTATPSIAKKPGTRPPKYKPPTNKPEQKRLLHFIQEDEQEEDEELRPRDNVPLPAKASTVDRDPRRLARSKSPGNTLNKSKSPDRFPDEEKAYGSLKRFYGSLVEGKKFNRTRTMEDTKRSVEDSIFGAEDKENAKPNFGSKGSTKSGSIRRSGSVGVDEKTAKLPGQIVKRSHTESVKPVDDWKMYYSSDRDVFDKSMLWLNGKYPARADVVKMKEDEMSQALEVMKGEKELKNKIGEFMEEWFEEPQENIKECVEKGHVENSRDIIEMLLEIKRAKVHRMINFLHKFSHIGLLREIAENKSKITKVNMSISKLRRENNKIRMALKEETNVKKNPLRKDKKPNDTTQLKRTSFQENDTKIMMMSDIKLRLTQKNVMLVLKWFYYSSRLRNKYLEKIRQAYNNQLLYCAMSGLYSNKQYKVDRKKQQELASDHLRLFWTGQLIEHWRKIINFKKQKRVLYQGMVNYSKEKLKKKGFYGILMRVQYKKTLQADIPLANKFNEYRLSKKALLAFKYEQDYEEIAQSKKKNFENFYSGRPNKDPREKPLTETVVKDSQAMGKIILNRLSILASRRDYYYDPLLRTRTLLKPQYKAQGAPIAAANMTPSLVRLRTQTLSNQSFKDISLIQEDTPVSKALVYKRKRYVLGQISQGSIFEELKDHIRSLVKVRGTIEQDPTPVSEPPKGVINLQALQKFYKDREEKKIKASLFAKWKIAFLEKWTNIEADLYHTMNLSKMALQKFKDSLNNRKELEDFVNQKARHKVLRQVFDRLKEGFVVMKRKEGEALLELKTRKSFEQWKAYHATRKAKESLYDKFRVMHQGNLKNWIYKAWKSMTVKHQKTRELTKEYLKQKAFRRWTRKYNKRVLLKNVFGSFIERANYYFDHIPKNNFQLLSCIVKAWRNEVIENENTAQQKIKILFAQNHRKQTLRVKCFRAWRNVPSRTRSLELATSIFKHFFRKNVLKKWSYIAQYTNFRIASLQENKEKLQVLRCFQALYRYSLQSKLVRCFLIRRYFLKWSTHFHLKTEAIPRRFHIQHIYRAFFNYLKEKRKNKIIELKNKFIANRHNKRNEIRLVAKVFYRFMENMVKGRKKRLLYNRLAVFKNKALVKKTLQAWKRYKYVKFEWAQKKKLADAFRQHYLATLFRIPPGKKTANLQYQVLTLAFNGWRAQALKSKNVQHIVNRFRKFKERITKRNLFNRWYERYRDERINSHQLPTVNINFEKYLKTDADKMKRYEDRGMEIRYDTAIQSWQEERTNTRMGDTFSSDRDLWMEGHRRNEEFMRKLKEMKQAEERYFKKYT